MMMVLVSLTFFIGFKDSQESVQAQVKWAAANALAFVWKHKVTLPQLGQKKQEKDLKELAPLAIADSDKASTDKEAKGTKDKEAKGTPAANSLSRRCITRTGLSFIFSGIFFGKSNNLVL